MAMRSEIVRFLDDYLKVSEVDESSLNGLQVEGADEVKKVALAVDACQAVFERARESGADMIIVHHGLLWKGTDARIRGLLKRRLEVLIKGGISLYAAHHPLDFHPEVGNNACMAKLIGLRELRPFGSYEGVVWGYSGKLGKEYTIEEFIKLVEGKIGRVKVKHLFGKKTVRTAAIVSGGGAFAVDETDRKGIDILISGEQKHMMYNNTKELCSNAIYLGHYDSEAFGVKALGKKLEGKFKDVETVFIDNPTGL